MVSRHDFSCDKCGSRAIDVVCGYPPEKDAPIHCGQPMSLDWMQLPQSAQVFEAITTRNVLPDGQSFRIASKGDLEFIAREYGIRRDYDDPDLEARGSEIRKKTPKIGKVFDFGGRR